MRAFHNALTATFLALSSTVAVGCGHSALPTQQPTGAIDVAVSTTAATISDVDPDGYLVSVDGEITEAVGVNGGITIGALARGVHLVKLHGLAPNCSVNGTNPRSVNVSSDRGPPLISFLITCAGISSGAGDWDY